MEFRNRVVPKAAKQGFSLKQNADTETRREMSCIGVCMRSMGEPVAESVSALQLGARIGAKARVAEPTPDRGVILVKKTRTKIEALCVVLSSVLSPISGVCLKLCLRQT